MKKKRESPPSLNVTKNTAPPATATSIATSATPSLSRVGVRRRRVFGCHQCAPQLALSAGCHPPPIRQTLPTYSGIYLSLSFFLSRSHSLSFLFRAAHASWTLSADNTAQSI